jgi:hypothetical protein
MKHFCEELQHQKHFCQAEVRLFQPCCLLLLTVTLVSNHIPDFKASSIKTLNFHKQALVMGVWGRQAQGGKAQAEEQRETKSGRIVTEAQRWKRSTLSSAANFFECSKS